MRDFCVPELPNNALCTLMKLLTFLLWTPDSLVLVLQAPGSGTCGPHLHVLRVGVHTQDLLALETGEHIDRCRCRGILASYA